MNEHTKGLLRVGHSGAVVADHPGMVINWG